MIGGPEGRERSITARVAVLPDALINQIAAGEVVERPSSVVKELVENALDAEARRVDVEIETGGVALCRVTDDGVGMAPEDVPLAVLRHATSKVRDATDLESIASYGFRGEALPSIASVSRFSLRSRPRGAPEGVEIRIEGAEPPEIVPCGMAEGTSVEVRELFFNVPARRKFLRAVGTESAHVSEIVQAAAFARPEITFKLSRDGRVVREWLRAPSREERVRAILADEPLSACRGERGPLRIEAYLSRPERARTGAGSLSVFVNDRPIKDRAIARAVAHAYGSVLEPGRYPIGALYLDLPFDLVDVNVHPQKSEVRFAEGRAVADAVYRLLSTELSRSFGLVSAPAGASRWASQPGSGGAVRPPPDAEAEHPAVWSAAPATAGLTPPLPYPMTHGEPVPAGESHSFGRLVFLMQVRMTYLICEGQDGLYFLDQHAAAERVTFDRLKKGFSAKSMATQKLLFPEVVEVTPAEAALLEENRELVEAAGLDARLAGPTSAAIHGVPRLLARASPERLLHDLLSELGRIGTRAYSSAIDLALATMACHGSLRAGDAVSREEATALLEALDGTDFAGHCPHGRPIIMRVGWNELEHRVGRR